MMSILFLCPLQYLITTRPNFIKFLCMLHVAVAMFSFDGVAMRRVFPVLWITSRFLTVGSMVRYLKS